MVCVGSRECIAEEGWRGHEGDCPGTAWHILEIVVNGGMVLEVGTRWVGFGRVRYSLD